MKKLIIALVSALVAVTTLAQYVAGITAASPHFITDGLVGWWRFNAGAGTSETDASGRGNTATLTSVSWTNSVPVTKFVNPVAGGFLATNSAAVAAYSTAWDFTNSAFSISMSILLRTNRASTSGDGLLNKRLLAGGSFPFRLSQAPTNSQLQFARFDGVRIPFVQSTNLQTGVWYRIACVRTDSGLLAIYVNGQSQGTTTDNTTNTFSSSDFSIGRYVSSGVYYHFNGLIDDVRLFSRELTASEISQIGATR